MSSLYDVKLVENRQRCELLEDFCRAEKERLHSLRLLSEKCEEVMAKIDQVYQQQAGSLSPRTPTGSRSPRRPKSPSQSFIVDMSEAVELHKQKDTQRKIAELTAKLNREKADYREKDRKLRQLKLELVELKNQSSALAKCSTEMDTLYALATHCNALANDRVQFLQGLLSKNSATRSRNSGNLQEMREKRQSIKRRRDELVATRDRLEAEVVALEAKAPAHAVLKDIPEVNSESDDSENDLDDAALERRKLELLKQLAIKRNEEQQRKNARKTQTPLALMSETMSLVKATVIKFNLDLKKIASIQRLSEKELEHKFKAGHNEVKVCLGFCLSGEEAKIFAKNQNEVWPVTPEVIEAEFPQHKLEQAHVALQDMVISWDGLPTAAKQRLTTARDVVANAETLFVLAKYVERQRAVKWTKSMLRNNTSQIAFRTTQVDPTENLSFNLLRRSASPGSFRNLSATGSPNSFRQPSASPDASRRQASSPRHRDASASPKSFRRQQSSN